MSTENHKKLTELGKRWNTVEKYLKSVEQTRGIPEIAAINELRYAGRKIVDAQALLQKTNLTKQNSKDISEAIIVASQYMANAEHDVTDAICSQINKEVSYARKRFTERGLAKKFPEIGKLYKLLNEVNSTVRDARERRVDREEYYYDLRTNYVPKLLEGYEKLLDSEVLPISRQRQARVVNFLGATALVVTVFLNVLGATGSLASIAGFFEYTMEDVNGQSEPKLKQPDQDDG